jgi:hypothetical protein
MKNNKEIEQYQVHKELNIEEIYDKLRYAHQFVKDVLYMDNYDKLDNYQKNAIETLHGTMYLAEHYFIDF